jgi:hypothetical protein
MGADSDGGQAKGGASGKGGAKGDGNGAGKKTESTSSQTARKVSCPLISTWASVSARAPDFLRFGHRLTLSSSILKGDFPRPFCFRKNSANAKTRFAVDFSGPNVLDTIAQPQQNESHNLFFRFRLSVAVGFVVSAQSSAQSLFGSAFHAPIWKGNRSDSCGESNLN